MVLKDLVKFGHSKMGFGMMNSDMKFFSRKPLSI